MITYIDQYLHWFPKNYITQTLCILLGHEYKHVPSRIRDNTNDKYYTASKIAESFFQIFAEYLWSTLMHKWSKSAKSFRVLQFYIPSRYLITLEESRYKIRHGLHFYFDINIQFVKRITKRLVESTEFSISNSVTMFINWWLISMACQSVKGYFMPRG